MYLNFKLTLCSIFGTLMWALFWVFLRFLVSHDLQLPYLSDGLEPWSPHVVRKHPSSTKKKNVSNVSYQTNFLHRLKSNLSNEQYNKQCRLKNDIYWTRWSPFQMSVFLSSWAWAFLLSSIWHLAIPPFCRLKFSMMHPMKMALAVTDRCQLPPLSFSVAKCPNPAPLWSVVEGTGRRLFLVWSEIRFRDFFSEWVKCHCRNLLLVFFSTDFLLLAFERASCPHFYSVVLVVKHRCLSCRDVFLVAIHHYRVGFGQEKKCRCLNYRDVFSAKSFLEKLVRLLSAMIAACFRCSPGLTSSHLSWTFLEGWPEEKWIVIVHIIQQKNLS